MGLLDVSVFPGAKPPPRTASKAKPVRAPTRPLVAPAKALGLTGASPFAAGVHQAAQQAQKTTATLGSRFSTLRRQPYHQQARIVHAEIQRSGAAQRALARNRAGDKVSPFDVLLESSSPQDRQHLSAFARESAAKINASAREVNRTRTAPFSKAAPAPKGAFDTPSALDRITGKIGAGLSSAGAALAESVSNPSGFLQNPTERFNHPGLGNVAYAQRALSGLSGKLEGAIEAGQRAGVLGQPKTAGAIAGVGGGDIAVNALKDLGNLPREAMPALAIPAAQVAQGHPVEAARTVAQPYVDLAKHPLKSLREHPLNTALMASGAEGALGRSLGAVARSDLAPVALRRLSSTKRAPLELAPGQTEARHYSSDLLRKMVQVGREHSAARKGQNPNAAKPAPLLLDNRFGQALGAGQHAKLNRIVDEMSGVHQLASRENRVLLKQARHAAMPTRFGKKASEADVVSLAAQRVLRTPETMAEDLVKERARLESAYMTHRLRGTVEGKQNRLQVKSIDRVLQDPVAMANTKGVFASAQSYIDAMGKIDNESAARGAIDPARAEKAKWFPYAMAHMDAKYDPAKGLVDAQGDPLALAAIKAHAKEGGVSEPGFLQHQLNTSGSGSFYKPYRVSRARVGVKARTGAAFQRGGYEHTYEALVGQNAKSVGILDRLALHDKLVNRAGIGRPDLRHLLDEPPSVAQAKQDPYFTPREAKLAAYRYSHDANHNEIPGRPELVPVTAFAKRGSSGSQLRAIAEEQHPNDLGVRDNVEAQGLRNALEDAAVRDDGVRNVVLVPGTQVDRFLNNYKGSSAAAKAFGAFTQQFRRTVLPYSVHWGTQNITEGVLRGLIRASFNPVSAANHIRIARRFFQQSLATDARKAADIKREAVGGTLYNAHDPLARHNPNPGVIRSLFQNNQVLRHTITPVLHTIGHAHNLYADHIGAGMAFLERGFRHIAVGKKVQRDLQEFSHSWARSVRASGSLMQQIVGEHHADPAKVAELGRYVDDAFGKYSKLGPATRAAVQSIAPFATWSINAAKFVYWTLPAEHPVKTAVLASAETVLAQDIADGKKLPLSANVAEQLGRLTPFGIATAGKTGALGGIEQGVTSMFLPQVMGAYNVLHGQNVFGDAPLYGPNGQVTDGGQRGWLALNALAEAVAPGLTIARTIREGGGRTYGTSTVFSPQTKPGPGYGVLNKVLNPFHSFSPPGGGGGISVGPAVGRGPAVGSGPAVGGGPAVGRGPIVP